MCKDTWSVRCRRRQPRCRGGEARGLAALNNSMHELDMHGLKRLVKRDPKKHIPSNVLDGLAFADMAINRSHAETDPAALDTVLTNSWAADFMSFQLHCHTAGARALAAPRGRLHEFPMRGLEHL